jgi:hypothetical protein
LYPNVSHQIAARLYIGIWRCILIVLCVCIKLYTSTYIAKNRYGLPRRREYLVGVNSFSHFWSVLSPSLRLVWSSSGPSFPGSPFLSTNVWERLCGYKECLACSSKTKERDNFQTSNNLTFGPTSDRQTSNYLTFGQTKRQTP